MMWKLSNYLAEQGLHDGDLLVEITTATLASGTCSIPTKFQNGQVVALFANRCDTTTIAADGTGALALTSDLVVTNGAITVSTTVNTYSGNICVMIVAKPTV